MPEEPDELNEEDIRYVSVDFVGEEPTSTIERLQRDVGILTEFDAPPTAEVIAMMEGLEVRYPYYRTGVLAAPETLGGDRLSFRAQRVAGDDSSLPVLYGVVVFENPGPYAGSHAHCGAKAQRLSEEPGSAWRLTVRWVEDLMFHRDTVESIINW